jgi:hypothetical protein
MNSQLVASGHHVENTERWSGTAGIGGEYRGKRGGFWRRVEQVGGGHGANVAEALQPETRLPISMGS